METRDIQALLQNHLWPAGIRLALAGAVFILGRWLARSLMNLAERMMNRTGLDEMLNRFLSNLLYSLLLAAVAIAALNQLGVDTTSLLAILGAAGLAVGLALKDSLSSFASGAMLILFRPFRTGDFIEAAGVSGTVEAIRIYNTVIRTGDNREILIPNSQIYGGTIINHSARETRRIDLVISIGYQDDLKKAREILETILSEEERILSDPPPSVSLGELADSSVNFNVRPWVKREDYWPVRARVLEQIKLAFDEQGISIPYPQQEVHLHKV